LPATVPPEINSLWCPVGVPATIGTMTDTLIRPSVLRSAGHHLLLRAGTVAGPLFLVVAIGQAVTRDGFDPTSHPVSLLSLGDLGWLQIANFILAGVLYLAGAVRLRTALAGGPGAVWGPRLIGALGAALVLGGVFPPDPALGYPPGTPDGQPDRMSFHGTVHAFAPALGFLALGVACFVFARRFGTDRRAVSGRSVAAVLSRIVGVLVVLGSAAATVTQVWLLLWGALVVGLGWSAVMIALAGQPPSSS
jgi:Protein of unknown function (DUF998)